jgi:virginiamycin B lyase
LGIFTVVFLGAGGVDGQVFTEFPVPRTQALSLGGIAPGPDGNVWVTASEGFPGVARIIRITPAGVMTPFLVPPTLRESTLDGITAGPGGNLWFTERDVDAIGGIGRITTAGVADDFPLPRNSSVPAGITAGSDGALWFTEPSGNRIGRMTTAGMISEFPLPTSGSGPRSIAAGPDGALWFTEQIAGRIGRLTTDGNFTEFSHCLRHRGGLTES